MPKLALNVNTGPTNTGPVKTGRTRRQQRRGAMLILFAVCLPIFIIMIVFAVDIAFMQLTRSELRTATDAAARAGSRTLSLAQDPATAIAVTKAAAARNVVAGEQFALADADITLGRSTRPGNGRFDFNPGGNAVNSVRVRGRRTDDSPAGEVNLFFGRLLGTESFEPIITSISTQIDRDIVLVIDRSGSMTFKDDENNYQPGWQNCDPVPTECRWLGLEAATIAFLQELVGTPQTELVGLATYNQEGTSDVQLSDNYSDVLSRIDELTNRFCGGSTGIGRGMIEGIDIVTNPDLNRPFASRVMVVLTDGIHNTGVAPDVIARRAADEEITIFTVTFSNFAEQSRMQDVADIGGGKHYHAPTGDDLIEVFREIAKTAANLLTE